MHVTSASAKLIVIRREHKSFLSEELKQSIDRVICDMHFKDFDRPLDNWRDLRRDVQQRRQWQQQKQQIQTKLIVESQQARGVAGK